MLTIFDCDGVLVDSELISLRVLSEIMTEQGHAMDVPACRDAFMGRRNADIVRAIEARIGRSLPGGGELMRRRMLERLRLDVRPVPGIAEALTRLGGRRCVASSSDRGRIAFTLGLCGLATFFGDHLFSGMEVAHGKPAPDLFLHAAERMGVAPAACVVIEDAVTGVTAGVAAGMRVIGFTGGSHTDPGHAERLREAGASIVIASMAELPGAIGETRGTPRYEASANDG